MNSYESFGVEELVQKGFTVDFLIEQHGDLLKRLRLESDIGEGQIPNQGKEDDPQDLESVAAYVIYTCVQWPYQDSVFGLDMQDFLQDAAVKYVNEYHIQVWGNINKSRIVDAALAARHDNVLHEIAPENQTHRVIVKALSRNPEQFKMIVEDKKSVDYALLALTINPAVLPLIAEKFRTEAVVDLAIRNNGLNLAFIKEEQKTAARCVDAVQQNPGAIVFVPRKLQKGGLLKTALSGNGLSVEYLDEALITPALQKVSIKENAHVLMIKESFCTPENLKYAAKHHPEIKAEAWFKTLACAVNKALSEPEH